MIPLTVTTIAITLFFTLNPVGNLPLFIAMLREFPVARQRYIIVRENIIALGLMIAFGLFGPYLLEGINISRFTIKIGGGVILFLIALNMVFPKHATLDTAPHKREPLIVPLATPLIAGGGTLTAVMMFGLSVPNYWTLIFGIIIAWFINSVILFCVPIAKRFLKEQVLEALEKLMGLILTLIACQMIVGGVISFVMGKDFSHPPISGGPASEAVAEEAPALTPPQPH